MNEKTITKTTEDWRDIAKGLQAMQTIYVVDIQENGISKQEDAPYIAIASNFIKELTIECLDERGGGNPL